MLKDKTLLITGAAGGLGSALAAETLARHATVILLDRDVRGLERIYDAAQAEGHGAPVILPFDLARAGPEDYDNVTSEMARQYGRLDAVVHTATAFDSLKLLEQIEPAEWFEHMQVNLHAPWMLTNACLPLLRASRAGMVIFMMEDLPRADRAFRGAYGISKHGLKAMVTMYAEEIADVLVVGINPGPMRTALRQKFYYAEDPADQPDPAARAREILQLLTGDRKPEGTFIDL